MINDKIFEHVKMGIGRVYVLNCLKGDVYAWWNGKTKFYKMLQRLLLEPLINAHNTMPTFIRRTKNMGIFWSVSLNHFIKPLISKEMVQLVVHLVPFFLPLKSFEILKAKPRTKIHIGFEYNQTTFFGVKMTC